MSGTAAKQRDTDDSALVTASLGGDREAFGKIVSRYQRLLCSLAYSATGDLSHSEDIAQDVFIEAWKRLDTLEDAAKLKAWLCGILRFKVSHFHRRESGQPIRHSDELNEEHGFESKDPRTEDAVIQDEEQALLWQAVQQVPETYREPLILFYREDRSAKQVALDLDLTEEAVKQRLSRGRKLLQAEMLSFVESALERSKPGASFTAAVLAAVAVIPPPAKAATVGAAAVKTGSWLKWGPFLTLLASVSGVISAFFGLRANLDQTRTEAERSNVKKSVAVMFLVPVFFAVAVFVLGRIAQLPDYPATAIAVGTQVLVVLFCIGYSLLTIHYLNHQQRFRAQQRLEHPEAFSADIDERDAKVREYRSRLQIAGVPLVHIRFGMPEKDDRPVTGWIAGGDKAYGLLLAWGGLAVAPVSVGIVSFGIISVGAVGFGLLGLGTVGVGVIGIGAAAVAYQAYASLSALGYESAFSVGLSVAKEAAVGPVAVAKETNNELAYEIGNLAAIDAAFLWVMGLIAALVIIPAVWHSNAVRRRMRTSDEDR